MTREAQRPPRDPDHGLHVLNMCWSLGFERGVMGGRYDREPALNGAERDQYFRGVMDGRATHAIAHDVPLEECHG